MIEGNGDEVLRLAPTVFLRVRAASYSTYRIFTRPASFQGSGLFLHKLVGHES